MLFRSIIQALKTELNFTLTSVPQSELYGWIPYLKAIGSVWT